MLRRLLFSSAALVVSIASGSAAAHDQWLESESAIVPTGSPARIRLFVGEDLKSDEEKIFERVKFTRLTIGSRNGPVDLLGAMTEGAKPAVVVERLGQGEFLVAADRAPVHIELAPEKFESYLREEGLERIVRERSTRSESAKQGRERYTRFLKSLVHVGDDTAQGRATIVIGQKLEIVLDAAPSTTAKLSARILFEGRPLGGAAAELHVRSAKTTSHKATSAPDGRVTFPTVGSGLGEIRLVHMRRCVEACTDTEWESYWASFTFWLSG